MLEPVQMETQIAGTSMEEDDFFSKAFMFSISYQRLEGKVPPPPGIELGSEMSQVSEVNECILQSAPPPPFPAHDAMPDKETCEFQFQMDIWNLQMKKNQKKIFLNWCQIWVGQCMPCLPPRNKKVGLKVKVTFQFWLMYAPQKSEIFFYPKLDLSWPMYPPPPPKNQKIFFFYLKLDLSWPMYPPLLEVKKIFKKLNVSFLDYVQLLVISRVIQVTKVNQN